VGRKIAVRMTDVKAHLNRKKQDLIEGDKKKRNSPVIQRRRRKKNRDHKLKEKRATNLCRQGKASFVAGGRGELLPRGGGKRRGGKKANYGRKNFLPEKKKKHENSTEGKTTF